MSGSVKQLLAIQETGAAIEPVAWPAENSKSESGRLTKTHGLDWLNWYSLVKKLESKWFIMWALCLFEPLETVIL